MSKSPLDLLKVALKLVKANSIQLAANHNIFLEEDEAGNIWLSEDGEECYKVNGWYLTYNKINEIIKRRELRDIENAR